jgi:hypothetical protein
MTNSSKYKDELLKAFMAAGKDKALLDAFLEDLLTQKELQEIPSTLGDYPPIAKG